MKGTAANPQPTDGGVVLTLFLCVAAITYAMFSAIKLFVGAKYPKERNERRLVRLLSGSANLGNGIVHALLIAVLYANRNSSINFYVKELEEGYAGPIFLMIINTSIGLYSLRGGGPLPSLCWNAFVAFAGSLIPMVWLRFIEEGLSTWPYVIIFIWLSIFAMELTAVTSSITWWALKDLK